MAKREEKMGKEEKNRKWRRTGSISEHMQAP
jgi:hypothetical protein